MAETNGRNFIEFEELSTEQKLNYIYLELKEQRNAHRELKKDLKWWVTIFGGIVLTAYEFGKAYIKRKFGMDDG